MEMKTKENGLEVRFDQSEAARIREHAEASSRSVEDFLASVLTPALRETVPVSRYVAAACRYLEAKGYEIKTPAWGERGDIIVAEDGSDLVFAYVRGTTAVQAGFEQSLDAGLTIYLERSAAEWMNMSADVEEKRVRYDEVSIIAASNNKAMLRHHLNFLNTMKDEN